MNITTWYGHVLGMNEDKIPKKVGTMKLSYRGMEIKIGITDHETCHAKEEHGRSEEEPSEGRQIGHIKVGTLMEKDHTVQSTNTPKMFSFKGKGSLKATYLVHNTETVNDIYKMKNKTRYLLNFGSSSTHFSQSFSPRSKAASFV